MPQTCPGRRNHLSRLVRKEPERIRAAYTAPATFTLNIGSYGGQNVVVIVLMRTFSTESSLAFEIVERRQAGVPSSKI